MVMEKYELQKLRDLPIEGVAERLGLRVVRHKALCPFHDDHHASLSFSVRRNSYRCFVCGAHGGPIDLVMKYLNKPFLDACRWLADEHNVIISDKNYTPEPTPCVRLNFQAISIPLKFMYLRRWITIITPFCSYLGHKSVFKGVIIIICYRFDDICRDSIATFGYCLTGRQVLTSFAEIPLPAEIVANKALRNIWNSIRKRGVTKCGFLHIVIKRTYTCYLVYITIAPLIGYICLWIVVFCIIITMPRFLYQISIPIVLIGILCINCKGIFIHISQDSVPTFSNTTFV